MSETVASLLERIMDLPVEDQRLIAEHIQDCLEAREAADQLMADPEWRAEFERRLQLVADGTAELIPWEEAREQIRSELARRRAKA
ncbi:MAG TPA: addiction module protein [Fimbriiglobus sp.]|nr:addiction module protein [Fimbriiglobus sp.]